MIRAIPLPVDGSEHVARSVDLAADVASKGGCTLVPLHVQTGVGSARVPKDLGSYVRIERVEITAADLLRQVAAAQLRQAEARARRPGAPDVTTALVTGAAAACIAERARANRIDLTVMQRRGPGDLGGRLLGSVSHKTAQVAPCACMTVR